MLFLIRQCHLRKETNRRAKELRACNLSDHGENNISLWEIGAPHLTRVALTTKPLKGIDLES